MKRKRKIIRKSTKPCFFCQKGVEPDFKNIEVLEKYTSDRGKIVARSKTGLCQKHQKRVTKAIKQARFLALLPYVAGF
jgi:small subunit ribosomal protein S18